MGFTNGSYSTSAKESVAMEEEHLVTKARIQVFGEHILAGLEMAVDND